MSVQELSIEDKDFNSLDVWPGRDGFCVSVNCGVGEHGTMHLSLGNAHLLFLYLQQHAQYINPPAHEQTK